MKPMQYRDNHDQQVRDSLPQDLDTITRFDILRAAGYTVNASKRVLGIA